MPTQSDSAFPTPGETHTNTPRGTRPAFTSHFRRREAADSLKRRAEERLLRATSRGSHGVLMPSGRATTASSTTRPASPARTTTNKTRPGCRRRREMALPRSAGPGEVPIRHFPPPHISLACPPLRKLCAFSQSVKKHFVGSEYALYS